jgi:type IV pilus assembly protein PilV
MRGAFLLEALVALVVFSLALIGLASGVAAALAQMEQAQWRSEAIDIASGTIGRIDTEDSASLRDRYAADGDGYRALFAQAARLPGVTRMSNAPRVEIDDAAEGRIVRVTLFWQRPGDARVHQASITGVVPLP